MWGVKDREAHVNIYIRPKGPVPGRIPPRPWEEPSSAMDVAKDKGSNPILVTTPRVTPWNRKNTKTEKKATEKMEMYKAKAVIIAFSALHLT